jgi:hypothetical protein
MRAILIDSINRQITEIDIDGELNAIKKSIKCDYIGLIRVDNKHHMYIDDEFLINDKHTTGFKPNFYNGQLGGHGIIFAIQGEGDEAPCELSLDDIQCEWLVVRDNK